MLQCQNIEVALDKLIRATRVIILKTSFPGVISIIISTEKRATIYCLLNDFPTIGNLGTGVAKLKAGLFV